MSRMRSGWRFALVAVVGMLAIAGALLLAERRLPAPLPWAIYLGNLLFFSGAAHAAVLCAALGRLSGATWMKPLAPLAESGIGFAVVAPIGALLLGLLPGDALLAPRQLPADSGPHLATWLSARMVLIRAVLVLVLLALAGLAYVGAARRSARSESAPRAASIASRLAGIYVAAYVAGLSLLAFDLVMPLMPHFRSAIFGGHQAATSFAVGVAGLALASRAGIRARSGDPPSAAPPSIARDLGALLAVAAFLASYFAFTQLITIWYGNLRDETGIFTPLAAGSAWHGVALAILGLAYLAPFLLLIVVRRFLPARLRGGTSLALVGLMIAIGLWLEQLLLVTAPFAPAGPAPLWLPAGLMAVGFGALFAGLLGLARLRLTRAAGDAAVEP